LTIRVLIVDDSQFVRVLLRRIVAADPRFAVAGEAKDGKSALEAVELLQPDVVSMDVNMPGMDGVATVAELMRRRPTPVVMLSAHTREGGRVTLDALAAGAVDFLAKPSGERSADLSRIGAELLDKLEAAARTVPRAGRAPPPRPSAPRPSASGAIPPPRPSASTSELSVVVIGVSTGGPSSLPHVLGVVSPATPLALVVVQHMPSGFTEALAERLDTQCAIAVAEAVDGDRLRRGTALVAPGGHHLDCDSSGRLRLADGPPVNGCKPSVDVTMTAIARVFGRRAIGVLMTGMGRDGAEGLRAIQQAGGRTLAQDEASSVVYGMPRAAVELGAADEVLPLDAIGARIEELAGA
jgi:two-component system, chemotaxis family, protein-glutamate methylesterase/glutaminase